MQLAKRARLLMGGRPAKSYEESTIAGVSGEQEHAGACITTVFGDALRESFGGGKAWISSNTKLGSAGEFLDNPLACKAALYVKSHYDTVTLRVPDAPRSDELVVAVALSSRPKIHHRLGGLRLSEATRGDGLR